MKNIIAICTILIISCTSAAFAQTYKPDVTYECNYQINKYTTGSCTISTNSEGQINSSICDSNAPSLDILITNNKCKLTPQKMYKCKYPNGECKVKLIGKEGHEISCAGTTPTMKQVYQETLSGKCTPIK